WAPAPSRGGLRVGWPAAGPVRRPRRARLLARCRRRPREVLAMALLEVKGLTMEFGGLRAVDNVDFVVHAGEILSIIGPNGAGKTTVFNILTGIYHPSAGELVSRGQRLNDLKPHQITAMETARNFQNNRLFREVAVWENVVVGAHTRLKSGFFSSIFKGPATRREERAGRERAYRHLEFVGLKGLETVKARQLPYGAQRRLEIARALAAEPKLLLLDEPAAGMNAGETEELMNLIRKLKEQNITVLLIEHDMRMV